MGTEYMILNGELIPKQEIAGAYIYQYIHTVGYSARNLTQHIGIINQSSQALFGEPFNIDKREIEQDISTLLGSAHLSRKVSIRVTLKLYATGDVVLEYDEPSFYSGYVMRSLRPKAVCLRINPPLEAYPTSAAEATYGVAEAIARAKDYHTAIMIDSENLIRNDSSHPIAIVKGKTVILPATTILSVERTMLERATCKAGYAVQYDNLCQTDLAAADEVIVMDWQGITAIEQINNKPYMAILAEQIASELESVAE